MLPSLLSLNLWWRLFITFRTQIGSDHWFPSHDQVVAFAGRRPWAAGSTVQFRWRISLQSSSPEKMTPAGLPLARALAKSRGIKSSSRYHQVTSHEIKAREHSQPRLGQARILYHRPLRSPCFLQNPRIRVTLSWKWGSRQWATVGLDNLSDLTLPAQGCAASRRLMIAVLFHDESFTPKSIIPRCDVGG